MTLARCSHLRVPALPLATLSVHDSLPDEGKRNRDQEGCDTEDYNFLFFRNMLNFQCSRPPVSLRLYSPPLPRRISNSCSRYV
jgi:hypothetical protein